MKNLKKISCILIGICLVLSTKVMAATGTINIDATRLRKEKNTTSEILNNIYKDEKVEILSEDGEWLKVKYQNDEGYVKKAFVTVEEKQSNKNNTTTDTNTNTNTNTNANTNTSVTNTTNADQAENTTTLPETSSSNVLQTNTFLRISPNFMSKKTQELQAGSSLKMENEMGNWVEVSDGSVSGWILKNKLNAEAVTTEQPSEEKPTENVVSNTTNTPANTTADTNTTNTVTNTTNTTSTESKNGKVNVETAIVREKPSTSAEIVDYLDQGDMVTITEEEGDWYKIQHQNIKGYISKKLITIIDEVSSRSLTEERVQEVTATPIEEQAQVENPKTQENTIKSGNEVIAYAKQYLGYAYVSGGKTPQSGFDCSGFTRYVFQNFGYELASTAAGQTSVGTEVARENLQPGDLILFYDDAKSKIGHTAIYLGNNEFIHAANPKRGVVTDNINTNSYYNERFVTARRIVQ